MQENNLVYICETRKIMTRLSYRNRMILLQSHNFMKSVIFVVYPVNFVYSFFSV